jgi:hypothetical protein
VYERARSRAAPERCADIRRTGVVVDHGDVRRTSSSVLLFVVSEPAPRLLTSVSSGSNR